ncbi:MAG: ice-binding family protein, partial [Desulfobaccales bacterium]
TSTTATLPTQTPPAVWAVQVVVPKSSSNNGGPLQLIFGPILGIATVNLSGTAVAMVKSPSVIFSVLQTGGNNINVNGNVTITGGSVGDDGTGLTLNSGDSVPGGVYINTATSVTNNSAITPVQNNTLLSQAVSAANTELTTDLGLVNNTGGTYSNVGQMSSKTITGNNTVNVADISSMLLTNPYSLTLTGNSTASFVVRVSGTFTLNANTSVLLSGGLTANNVTFIPTGGGTVIIDSGATLNGSILSASNSVTLNSGAILNGSIITGGQIMLDTGPAAPTGNSGSTSGSSLVQ